MQFMLQFTHVLDILEFEEENKTKKCFGNFFLQIFGLRNSLENLFCPQNLPMIMDVFIVFKICFKVFAQVVLWTSRPLLQIILSKQFSKKNSFCFLL